MNSRIGLITYALDRAPGGIARYTRELLQALQTKDVPILRMNAGRMPSSVGAVELRGAGLLPGLLTIGQFEIAWNAFKNGLDLIHDPTGTAPLMLSSTKRVVTIHDTIPYIYPRASTGLDRMIYRFWLPLVLQSVENVITVSQRSKLDIAHYLKVSPQSITVIPEAPGSNYCLLPDESVSEVLSRYGLTTRYILSVGSIEPRKNIARLIEAYAEVIQQLPELTLVLVGSMRQRTGEVLNTVERLNLGERVRLLGFVPENDLPALYNGADVFVFPSLYEGFGLPVLEAMACGTPVVASNTSSVPEVAGDAAILVDPLDTKAMAYGICSVLEDPIVAAELAQRGLARAACFTWDRTANETISVYERALA